MRISLPADLLLSTAFDSRMVLQNHNTLAARAGRQDDHNNNSNSNNCNTSNNNIYTMGHQRPILDLLVAMIAVPILIMCALQLEKNLHDMATSPESRWLVFALGIGMLVISIVICGYVTHRMGVCIWTGPIDEAGNRLNGRTVAHNDILRMVDSLPPSYDSVVKFDIPPPSYDCLVIDREQYKEEDDDNSKEVPTEMLHM